MGALTKTLYDTDFAERPRQTAEMLRAGRLEELDLENVAEEIESLGKSEHAAARSQIKRLLMHKIKQIIQPERDGTGRRLPIAHARQVAGAALIRHGAAWRRAWVISRRASARSHRASQRQLANTGASRNSPTRTNLMRIAP